MASSAHQASRVVLVVEDEPLLRMHAADIVEAAGFEALEAGNADEAIEMLDRRDDISIVFADIDMPGSMDGLGLAAAIRHRWPPIELILTSGLIHVAVADMPRRGVFFSKPYSTEQIQKALKAFMN
jgi:CheY-like chemotaxis protein